MNDSDQPSLGPEQGSRLGALATLARRVLVVERVWPPLVFALAVVILFLAASWLGVWQFAPRAFRILVKNNREQGKVPKMIALYL